MIIYNLFHFLTRSLNTMKCQEQVPWVNFLLMSPQRSQVWASINQLLFKQVLILISGNPCRSVYRLHPLLNHKINRKCEFPIVKEEFLETSMIRWLFVYFSADSQAIPRIPILPPMIPVYYVPLSQTSDPTVLSPQKEKLGFQQSIQSPQPNPYSTYFLLGALKIRILF